ncbi:UrcA family protein [Lysobacter sp. CW239]|uniref:UrcA family protein n=1 Tax=Lysobacteraceae TaxID=32033 RepID=UPI0009FE748A|nr:MULTISPECIES: UrcA family protein [Lysobacter]QOD90891.1 UrcA family protein [Lysobacter sp. CW239]
MTSRISATGAGFAALLIGVSAAGSAVAQEPTDLNTITVLAPRITYQTTRDRESAIPKKLEIAQKSAMVDYGDLDLTRTADLYTLKGRVEAAATRICGELTELFPDGTPSTTVCTRRATDDAMAQVERTARNASR